MLTVAGRAIFQTKGKKKAFQSEAGLTVDEVWRKRKEIRRMFKVNKYEGVRLPRYERTAVYELIVRSTYRKLGLHIRKSALYVRTRFLSQDQTACQVT